MVTLELRRRRLVGTCMLLGPLVMLAADVVLRAGRFEYPADYLWTIGLQIAMVLLVGAVLGLIHVLRPAADRTVLTAGCLAVIGLMYGFGMQVLFRARAVLYAQLDAAAWTGVEPVLFGMPMVASSVIPGLLFPIGTVTLGCVALATGRLPKPLAALLCLGAVLFPIGRIGGFWWVTIASDLCLAFALGWLGRLVNAGTPGEAVPEAPVAAQPA
ncbi:MAG TPA: hypothetical protein VHQ65_03910 [Thermoanaerobaculia bacterium]|nr:hypothetical protein [Thermoanaerobaculia bacterium]